MHATTYRMRSLLSSAGHFGQTVPCQPHAALGAFHVGQMRKDKWTIRIKILVILLMTIAYVLFAMVFFLDNDDDWTIAPIFYLWMIGGLLYAAAITYAVRTNAKAGAILVILLSGAVWIFPPLMFAIFGIPCLIVYPFATGWLILKNNVKT